MQERIEKIISEDMTYHNEVGNRYDWMQKSQPVNVSILDVLKMDGNEWQRTKAVLPYQANPITEKILLNLENCHDLKTDFNRIISHPLIKKDEEKREVIKKVQSKLNGIMKAYTEIMKELDNLRLGD